MYLCLISPKGKRRCLSDACPRLPLFTESNCFRIDVLLVYFYTALLLVCSLSKISFLCLLQGSLAAPFPKASAKVQPFSELTKLFTTFFRKNAFFMKYHTKCAETTPLYFIRARTGGKVCALNEICRRWFLWGNVCAHKGLFSRKRRKKHRTAVIWRINSGQNC